MLGESMFINVSNHPSNKWSKEQYQAAKQYGDIVDFVFPQIDPTFTTKEVKDLVDDYFIKIEAIRKENNLSPSNITVMVSGEFTFSFYLVEILKANGYRPVCACTKRESEEVLQEDGSTLKLAKFTFIQFREY